MSRLLRVWRAKRLFRSLMAGTHSIAPTPPSSSRLKAHRQSEPHNQTQNQQQRASRHGPTATAPQAPAPLTAQARYIEAVAKMDFRRKRLLNKGEYKLLRALESLVPDLGPHFRLMAQTSLGEIIEPIGAPMSKDWKAAFHAINAKRLDFAIFDGAGYLVCAIEYQGQGHYQDGAFMPDAVKREALRLAGVPLVEIGPDFTKDEVRILIGRHLNAPPVRAAS